MSSKSPSTVTSTGQTTPWTTQQPYLETIFSQAKDLYQGNGPEYYPDSTVSAPNQMQTDALAGIRNAVSQDSITTPSAQTLGALVGGSYLNGPGQTAFGNFLTGVNPGTGELNREATTAATNSPGAKELSREAYTNATDSPAMAALKGLGNTNPFGMNPANSAFGNYASGARTAAGNPYSDALSQSILAKVVPGIQSNFIQGGMLSSPEAARATSEGATAALAPSFFQNYQNEEANQLAGAQGLSGAYNQGLAQQLAGANTWGSQALQSLGLQQGAATQLGNQGLASLGLQQGAASTLGNQALQAMQGLQGAYGQGVQQVLGGLALAPQVQAMPFTNQSQLYAAGATQQAQDQQQLNDLINRWNFTETKPYQSLNEYIGQVTGNYGGTSSLTQPYFQNSGANAIGGALGGAQLGSTIGGPAGGAAGAGLGALLALFGR